MVNGVWRVYKSHDGWWVDSSDGRCWGPHEDAEEAASCLVNVIDEGEEVAAW